MPELTSAWRHWIHDNTQRGCTLESMVDAMVAQGFAAGLARHTILDLRQHIAAPAAEATFAGSAAMPPPPRPGQATGQTPAPASATDNNAPYHYEPWLVGVGNTWWLGDRLVRVVARCEQPQIAVLDDLLSPAECDALIALAQTQLDRSTTVDPATGELRVIAERTSEGCAFQRGQTPLIQAIERRLAAAMGLPVDHGEGLQVLHYQPGGEYRAHFDYFPPDDPGSAQHIGPYGQRVSTLVMYLNDVPEGGATTFPQAHFSVTPKKGSAVLFKYRNTLGQLDTRSLHAGAPVLRGDKWILTKWVRERRYG
jgi:prolyl 4-hydroxylase